VSEYSKQLREKQKVKRAYGMSESQFRSTFDRVRQLPGVAGENLLAALELRLDNIVYRMGFAASRKGARQLVRHKHVEVNGKIVDVPSYRVRPNEVVGVTEKSREQTSVRASLEALSRGVPVSWITINTKQVSGTVTERPTRDAIPIVAQEQLIVELYSR
jgi:small subunit ribosomal protein S4